MAYWILQRRIVAAHGRDSVLASAVGSDLKGNLSPVAYLAAIVAALASLTWVAHVLYVAVALIWIVPDRRIEKALARESRHDG